MKIVPPPERIPNPFKQIPKDLLDDYVALASPIDEQGRYLHYDEVRFRLPKGIDIDLGWSVIKLARQRQLNDLVQLGETKHECGFFLTPTIQKAISETDRHATDAALKWMLSQIGEQKHLEYLFNDLVQDEAISSSQMEGAATTTKIARKIIQRQRQPRTIDEKMILGNFKMMNFAWQNRDKDLSLDLILDLHRIGVDTINDEHYNPGILRKTDSVVVVDERNNVLHTPPPAAGLTKRLEDLVKWTNADHHDSSSKQYIHPLIKAITLHFAIGYEHPFKDGNGRVARSLFYWYMFKNDFAAFRFIAISVLLKTAHVRYGKSYLYTETDEMDLTYFIEYQCTIIIRAIKAFKDAHKQVFKAMESFNQWLWDSGLYQRLSENQKIVFQVAKNGKASYFTATNVQENLGCSYNTAAKVLNGLVELDLFKKEKQGREWLYSMLETHKIQKS